MRNLPADELLKLAVEQAFEGLQIIDFDFRYVYINEAAARHGQKPARELLGRTMMECFPGIEATPVFTTIKEVMETKRPQTLENEFQYEDRRKTWFELHIEPTSVGVLVRSLDITGRKNLESQLWQSQKLDAVGRLAGGIAHDYNNKLAIILAYCEMALSQEPPAQVVGYINRILDAVEQSSALTKQLLAFSRKQVLDLRNLNLNDTLKKMRDTLGRLLGESIKIDLHLADDLKLTRLDAAQTEQIILNLCINARDAMPMGGGLQIETRNAELDEHHARLHPDVKPGAYVRLTVSDNGMGMTKDVQQRVFEPFFTTKERDNKGTGLGLATVHGIVKQSNGHIWVYSEPGLGSVFKIYFPIAAEEKAKTPVRSSSTASLTGNEAILLIEDDALLRDAYSLALKGAGYEVHAAGDPEEAMKVFAGIKDRVGLVVTDLILPKMNGRKLAEQLMVDKPNLKVVYMSGYTENSIVHQGVLDTESVLMQKPISLKNLLEIVRKVIDGKLTKGIV